MTTNSTRSDAPANKPGLYAGIQAFADSIRPIPLTELEAGLTDDQKRTCSVEHHQHFIRSISTDSRGVDAIDREIDDDLIEVPWPEVNPPSRRKDSELARVLDILDNLPRGKDSE